ncbi:MAG: hypothetical protein LBQ12_11345 [Deltaproteobacteria bacterium]|jgi:flavodoxin|nr:hypothetical protein [Deltaproteobacteria bacterium]
MKFTDLLPKALAFAVALALAILVAAAAPAPAPAQGTGAPAAAPAFGKSIVIVFSLTGKTRSIAEVIAAKTGSDLYVIETASPYPSAEGEIIALEEARRAAGSAPELKGTPPDLGPYSFVFLGSPVWFGGVPDHVSLFLKEFDFGGRGVALFATAGSRPGDIIKNLGEAVNGGKVLSPGLVNRRDDDWDKEALERIVEEYLAMLKLDEYFAALDGNPVTAEGQQRN